MDYLLTIAYILNQFLFSLYARVKQSWYYLPLEKSKQMFEHLFHTSPQNCGMLTIKNIPRSLTYVAHDIRHKMRLADDTTPPALAKVQ